MALSVRTALLGAIILAATDTGAAEEPRRQVEITAALVRIRPDGGGASQRGTPGLICVDGEEGKLFIGRNNEDGTPDPDAVRIEFTPRILDDGRIQIKVVSLGTELGERPEGGPAATPARPGAEPGIVFHSAWPAERLYSLAGRNGTRAWMRIGQTVDGWTLVRYEEERHTLTLSRGGQTLRLGLTQASVTEPPAAGPRIETLVVQPGQPAQLVGKDGHRLVISARPVEGAPAGR